LILKKTTIIIYYGYFLHTRPRPINFNVEILKSQKLPAEFIQVTFQICSE